MVDYNLFLSKYYPTKEKQQKDDIIRFLKYVDKLAEEAPLSELLQSDTFLCRTFFIRKSNAVSRPHYQKIKGYLINLFDFIGVDSTVPSREEVLTSQQVISLFPDLNAVLDLVDYVGNLKLQDYNPSIDLVHLKSTFILAWYGMSAAEIASLPKKNLRTLPEGIYRIYFPDAETEKYVDIPKQYFDILDALRFADGYRGLPTGKKQLFKGSDDFLFRPVNVNTSIKPEQVTLTFFRFNREIPPEKHQFVNLNNLRKNALFVDIYNDSSDSSLLEKIMKHMNCNDIMAYGYKKQYEYWVKLFHKKEI